MQRGATTEHRRNRLHRPHAGAISATKRQLPPSYRLRRYDRRSLPVFSDLQRLFSFDEKSGRPGSIYFFTYRSEK